MKRCQRLEKEKCSEKDLGSAVALVNDRERMRTNSKGCLRYNVDVVPGVSKK